MLERTPLHSLAVYYVSCIYCSIRYFLFGAVGDFNSDNSSTSLTLTSLPQHHMFSEMRYTLVPPAHSRFHPPNKPYRAALGIDRSTDILQHIRELPTADRDAAVSKVQAVERRAMVDQQPQPGLVRLMDYLESRGLRRALCTRNFEYVHRHHCGIGSAINMLTLNNSEHLSRTSLTITSRLMSSCQSLRGIRLIFCPSLILRVSCILQASGGWLMGRI